MKELLLRLISAYALIWLADCRSKRKNFSNDTTNVKNKFSPQKGKRSWTAENTPKKIAEYEEVHYNDFLRNKDKYEVWPELNDVIPMMFCRKYIQKLFPFAISRLQMLPEKWPTINLYYTEISDYRTVNVTAAQCYVPKYSKRRYFVYIRAPQPRCVFLVKTLMCSTKPQFKNDFHIINEFCIENDPYMNKDLETSHEEHNLHPDIHYGSEMGKWIVRRQEKNTIKFRKKEKWLEVVSPETLAKYEKEHADNYVLSIDEYEIWPELEIMDKKSVCEKSLQYFFKESIFKKVYPTVLRSVKLQYVNMELEHNQNSPPPMSVTVLQCYEPNNVKRKYHYFVKTPRPHCLYVVRPLARSSCAVFKITGEYCEESEPRHRNSKKKRWDYECPLEDLQKYENAHYKEYSVDKDIYERWLELDILNKVMLCKKSMEPLFPSILHRDVQVSIINSAKLHYNYVTDCDGMTVTPNKVAVLKCYWRNSFRNKFYHFIKSTSSSCVFIVKNLARNLLHTDFKIVNQLCLDLDEYQKLFLSTN